MEASKPVLFGFSGNQFHFLFKGGILVYIHSDQAVLFFFNDTDF